MPKRPGTARVPKGPPTPKAGRRFVHLRVPLRVLQDVAAGFNLGAGYALRPVENKPTTAKPTTPDEAENGEPEVTPTEQIVRPSILSVDTTVLAPEVARTPPGIEIFLEGVEGQAAEGREATAQKAARALLQFLKYVTGRALSERVIQCKKCRRWFAAEKLPVSYCSDGCKWKFWDRAQRKKAGHPRGKAARAQDGQRARSGAKPHHYTGRRPRWR
jgi:hypothetical protein